MSAHVRQSSLLAFPSESVFSINSHSWEARNKNYCKSKNLFCKIKKAVILKNYDFSRSYKNFFSKLSPFSQVGVTISHP